MLHNFKRWQKVRYKNIINPLILKLEIERGMQESDNWLNSGVIILDPQDREWITIRLNQSQEILRHYTDIKPY